MSYSSRQVIERFLNWKKKSPRLKAVTAKGNPYPGISLKVTSRKYKIFIDPVAGRNLKRLKKSQPGRYPEVEQSIESLSLNPFQGKRLKGRLKQCFSLRIGNFRVIYKIYPEEASLNIIRVCDRKDIYRF